MKLKLSTLFFFAVIVLVVPASVSFSLQTYRTFDEIKFNEYGIPIGQKEILDENLLKNRMYYRFTFDSFQNHVRPIRVECIDEKGIVSNDNIYGVGIFDLRYNESAQLTKLIYYKTKDVITELYGIAIVEFKRDNQGREIEQRYSNQWGELCSGMAIVRFKYDSAGRLIEHANYDKNDRLFQDESTGIAIYRIEYDDKGRPIQLSFFGDADTMKEDSFGVAFMRYFYYDDQNGGKLKSIRKYDLHGNFVD